MTCLKDYLHYRDEQVTLLLGDALAVAAEMADDSADCIVTSPPYLALALIDFDRWERECGGRK